jgi:hypothetical protein
VSFENIEELIAAIKPSPSDPQFYPAVFTLVNKRNKVRQSGKDEAVVFLEEYDNLSKRLDRSGLQESCSVRNVLITRSLAKLLINDKGELLLDRIPNLISELKKNLFSTGPNRQHDVCRQTHILNVLQLLQTNKEIQRLLKNISKPISNRYAEEVIRASLQIPDKEPITDAHTRRAAVSAWLCYLRQSVGSCFATAPAIIVHDEQPLQFLKDINDILNIGRLKRTFGGIEYTAPFSISWGAGDLKRNVYFQATPRAGAPELWLSPGLLASFEAAKLISPDTALKEKIEQIKTLILAATPHEEHSHPFSVINAETILRRTLLHHFNLTEKDLQDDELKTRGMLAGLPTPSFAVKPKDKSSSCAAFRTSLESAENAFKALADNALLKAWEFTLASFAETKAGFTRWNLYSSLGLKAEDAGGIGPCIYEEISRKLEQFKLKIKDLQDEYEQLYSNVKYIEARMQRASSEKEAEWLKLDYKTKTYQLQTVDDLRDLEHHKAERTANLFNVLIDAYYELFPQYFQEVYDADMHEVAVTQYDDSPAGFRLLYKHGRTNISSWTFIHNPNEFIDALSSFFIATETELSSREEFSGLERVLSEIVTIIAVHIKTPEFLETAFYRMAAVHQTRIIKNPLENLDKIEKKPWAYTSGGSMSNLISCYFGIDDKPFEVARWVENPMELLVFLVDTVKHIPAKLMEDYIKNPQKSMLIHSPTHAFLLKPGITPFKEAWSNDAFTYTWVRDRWVKPRERFVDNLLLDEGAQEFIIQHLAETVSENYRYYFKQAFGRLHGDMSPVDFRQLLVETMERERGLQFQGSLVLQPDEIDSFFYSSLPIFPQYQMQEKLEQLFSAMPVITPQIKSRLMDLWNKLPTTIGGRSYATAKSLLEIAKALLCLELQRTSLTYDFHAAVALAGRLCGSLFPEPILFADTNWVKDYFGFTVNPGTGKLDFWRFDSTGIIGNPLSSWRQWLNGTRKDITWGIYTRPYEYVR